MITKTFFELGHVRQKFGLKTPLYSEIKYRKGISESQKVKSGNPNQKTLRLLLKVRSTTRSLLLR